MKEQIFVQLLELLEIVDQEERLQSLRDLSETIEGVEVVERAGLAGADLKLNDQVGIRFTEETSSYLKQIFHCWVKQYLAHEIEQYDELTGLYTRSYWERTLRHELAGQLGSLAMADIDYFKHFNDDYGHQLGDEVLAAVGRVLRDMMDKSEFVVRYGGEEFLILSRQPAARLQKTLEKFRLFLADNLLFEGQPEPVTVSLGLASEKADIPLGELIKRADRALYQAKAGGRNCCRKYAPYMARSDSYYIWGVYRYLWGTKNRFAIKDKGLLLYEESRGLCYYNWWKNSAVELTNTARVARPPRQLVGFEEGFALLDSAGQLCCLDDELNWQEVVVGDAPDLIALLTDGSELFAIGINNQLYHYQSNQLIHYRGLPSAWEQVLFAGEFYYLDEDLLKQPDRPDIKLPEPVVSVAVEKDVLYIVGESGKIYRFLIGSGNCSKLELINADRRVQSREIAVNKGRLLIRDQAGRLLLARTRSKAVPQNMDIRPK